MYRVRLEETIAWCSTRDVSELRTPDLEPRTLAGRVEDFWRLSIDERITCIEDIGRRRSRLIAPGAKTCLDRLHLGGGRLLLFDPDFTLSDGAACAESDRFFDENNFPAWDTWLWYVGHSWPGFGPPGYFLSYLVVWVPPQLIGRAEASIQINPEQCILWATDVDTAFVRELRHEGLLA